MATIRKLVEVEVDTLRMTLPRRYRGEYEPREKDGRMFLAHDFPDDFPMLQGNVWHVDIDIATRRIKDWPGPAFRLYIKVCDEGVYELRAGNESIATRRDYVPHGIVPGAFGDYVEINVEADGTITNMPHEAGVEAFEDFAS